MITKNKAGKSLMTVPKGGIVNQPAPVTDPDNEFIAAFSNEGRLLIFPVLELPQLGRGKGVKVMNIPKGRVEERIEFMPWVCVFSEVDTLVVASGKRTLNLTIDELEHYRGERARRGLKLPRGFQKVDGVTVEKGD
jgi:topoisomerase-4 subunit A